MSGSVSWASGGTAEREPRREDLIWYFSRGFPDYFPEEGELAVENDVDDFG